MFVIEKKLNTFSYIIITCGMLIFFKLINDSTKDNIIKCKFKEIGTKGIINSKMGHGSYSYIVVNDSIKSIRISIYETKYIKGFPENYTYEVGDSIIKKAGSKEFIVKRGNNIAVHIMDCDD